MPDFAKRFIRLKKETDNRMVVILLGKDPDHDIGYHEFRGSALETVLV